MTRVLLIQAGPTQWDLDERISGNLSLPLADQARMEFAALLQTLPRVDAVYRTESNDACDEIARMIAERDDPKSRDNPHLEAWNLGLWQGLRFEDLRQRYPTAVAQWEESPATVVPPEGESFVEAVTRLGRAARRILKRNRGSTVAIVLRPTALQIVAGVVRRETPEQIAAHLQNGAAMETIDLGDDDLKKL